MHARPRPERTGDEGARRRARCATASAVRVVRALVLALGMFLGATTIVVPAAQAAPYRFVREQSELVVRVFAAGPAAVLAHDHVVRAMRWDGTLDVTRDPVALAAEIRVDATALEVDDPEVRKRHGLDGVLSDEQRAEVRASMLGSEQLDVARYPEIVFRAAEIERIGDGFRIAGDLTLHGVTRRIAVPLQVREDGDALRATGSVRFEQSEFGIEPYSAYLGAVRNRDQVELVVNLVAVPAEPR
jgi:polyisoprenoid-binding protein YceI